MKIAAIQMISGPQVAPNLARAGELIARAAGDGARLVALPEYFPLIGASDADRLAAREQPGTGPIQAFLADAAARHGIWLVGGSLPLFARAADKLRNTMFVFDPQGRARARFHGVQEAFETIRLSSAIHHVHDAVRIKDQQIVCAERDLMLPILGRGANAERKTLAVFG